VEPRTFGGAYRSRPRMVRVVLTCFMGVALMVPVGARPVMAQAETVLTPVADSYIEAAKPTRNFGTRDRLRVDGSPILNGYLRFDVQGITDFSSAKLRLFFNTGLSSGLQVRPVADTSWSETTITYANAPAFGAVANTAPSATAGTWVEIDVTSLVSQNGLVSFALTSSNNTAVSISSREGANDPELVIGTSPPPPPTGTSFTVSRNGSTYQAASSSTTFTGSLKFVVESAVSQLNGAGGGTVTFTAGDFDLGADHFEFDAIANISFIGQGMAATTIRNFSNDASDTEPFDIVVGNNLVVRDLSVQAGGALRTTSDALDFDAGSGILIERVAVTISRGRAIIFDGKGAGWSSTDNVVRDCVITGIPGDGIEFLASSNNLVERCSISNVAGHGIQVTKSSTSAAQPNKKSNDNIVRNNTIDNSGQDGINVNSSDRNQISGNTITNSSDDTTGRDGIRIGSSDSITCNDNTVNGNLATDNQPTKTQSYGLNISSALCNRTVVGVSAPNDFAGNRVGPIRDLGTGTIYPPPTADAEPPTQPTGLSAVAISGCRVDLSWNASSDNVGVTGYGIYRGGILIGSVGGTSLTFQDTTVSPSTSYSYTVDAVDAATNRSMQSAPAPATTPSAACSITFAPIADSWVDASQPTTNFGTSTQIRVDGSPVLVSYLKFDVQVAGSVSQARLRIFANSSHSVGFSARSVADTSWGETTITYANAPAYGSVVASSGPFAAGTWVEVDVTSLVTANGQLSIALTTTSSTAMSLASRQSGPNAPQLIIETN
jgi:parallel beta-helix repeat protein